LFARAANESNVGSKKKVAPCDCRYVLMGGVWFGLLLRERAFARRARVVASIDAPINEHISWRLNMLCIEFRRAN
jgi:hypothetical protein